METIIQALNKAMLKGVFNLDESAAILASIDDVNSKLQASQVTEQ